MNRIDVLHFSLIDLKGFSFKIRFKMFNKLNYMDKHIIGFISKLFFISSFSKGMYIQNFIY